MYLNRVILIGFTGQQPKTLATRTGKELTRLRGNNPTLPAGLGMERKTQWHECVLYGATAHFAATLPKGSHVLIEANSPTVTSSVLSNPRRAVLRFSGQ